MIHTHNNVASLYGGMAGRLAGVGMVLNTRHGMADMPYDHRREQIYRASVTFLHRVAFVCHRALDFSVSKGLVPRRKAIVDDFACPRAAAKGGDRMACVSEQPWHIWIDRGGTFTDCVGREPHTGRLRAVTVVEGAVAIAPLVFRAAGGLEPGREEMAAGVISILLGVLAVATAAFFLARMARRDAGNALVCGTLLLVTPALQLFCGYVESYPPLLAATLIFFAAAFDRLTGGGIAGLVVAALAVLAALLSHPFGLTLLPALHFGRCFFRFVVGLEGDAGSI